MPAGSPTHHHRPTLRPDPIGVPRNPLAVYMLFLAFVSGVLTAMDYSASRAVDDVLPTYVDNAWGLLLAFGAAATLTGMYWPGAITTGLLHKRVGTFTLAVACLIFSVVILVAAGRGGLLTSGIVFGFGVAALWQYLSVERRIRAIIKATDHE